ncbi:DNA polymerase III subunit gamma/tau [Agromyces humi]|uniref:DNA polymerase III subunit gamma/tau n=1 Tax=Agromyces humi TaxID=1766800 RepID=UPI0013580CB8|nr:DNA polymerase III subunit gamma/tau [Agromyces humi]
MSPDADDDALRWEGDDDPTLAPGWKRVGEPARLETTTDAAGGAASSPAVATADADAPRQAGSVELVVLGLLGGVYLLYAIGWLIWASTPAVELGDPVAQFMYGLGRWFAVLAPVLWFAAVLWLAAEHRRARLLWLVAGAVLLVPVPFLLRG